jgi:hypothetical protein
MPFHRLKSNNEKKGVTLGVMLRKKAITFHMSKRQVTTFFLRTVRKVIAFLPNPERKQSRGTEPGSCLLNNLNAGAGELRKYPGISEDWKPGPRYLSRIQ